MTSLSKSFAAKRGMRLSKKRRKKERIKERKERKKKRKRKMRIKIDHVLTKIFQVPMKREIPFNKHSRITLATKYST